MKTENRITLLNALPEPTRRTLPLAPIDVCLWYDSPAAVEVALSTLGRIEQSWGDGKRLHYRIWAADWLDAGELSTMAAGEAARAHLLALALDATPALLGSIRRALERWERRQPKLTSAIALSLVGGTESVEAAGSLFQEISRFAAKANIPVFCEHARGEAGFRLPSARTRQLIQRGESRVQTLASLIAPTRSVLHWGLNE